jgi:hypothetical protein
VQPEGDQPPADQNAIDLDTLPGAHLRYDLSVAKAKEKLFPTTISSFTDGWRSPGAWYARP